VVRRGPVWFAVRMQPTANRLHVGDLRYDSGLAVAKRLGRGGGGRRGWKDVVPVRPATRAPAIDSAGPDVLAGGRVAGVPIGSSLRASPRSGVALAGAIRAPRGPALAPLRARYRATSCGVELTFEVLPGRTYEYSAFLRGPRSPVRRGGLLRGGDQTVDAAPAPVSVRLEPGYGSAVDPHLVRARLRFRVPRPASVRVTMC
jgi:hypothetical protein